ncbi:sugar kinase [Leifsonia sp. 2MCAF36]|uniref:sugar kinase n=1 Tax=Leifsonia sp. 2MCAF36 TaxID=3232988 RepID=UPI003F9E4CAA
MSETRFDLLTIGEAMVLVAPDDHGSIEIDARVLLGAGGAESNVAIGAAALGLRTAWLSRIGPGALGDLVRASVARRGVDVSHVTVDPTRPTGLMVKHAGQHASEVFYYRAGSAATDLSPSDLDGITPPAVVHISGILAALSLSTKALAEAIVTGALAPATISFDVNYRPSLWPSKDQAAVTLHTLAARADIVFVGRDEAEALWGTATAEEIRRLLPDVPSLVVKDADIEATEFTRTKRMSVPSPKVDVIEPVGAGDAFAAGWLAAFHRGDGPQERLAAGHAAAGVVLRSHSDQAPFESLSSMEASIDV